MGQRFDRLDAQHQGSLTPYEVEEIFIYTPANPSAAQSSGANESTNRLPASNGSSPSTTSSGNVQ